MNLLEALKTLIESASDVMAFFPGGVWTYQADEGSDVPSLILNRIGDGSEGGVASGAEYNTSKDYRITIPIQTTVYASTPEEAAELQEMLESRFFMDEMPLSNGEYVMQWDLTAQRWHKDLHPDKAGNPVYHNSSDYDALVMRKRS